MVINGQRISAFVSDCLCGIKAITIHAFKTVRFIYDDYEKDKDNQRKEISIRNKSYQRVRAEIAASTVE